MAVDQAFGDSVRKVFGIRVTARVLRRQYGDRVNRRGTAANKVKLAADGNTCERDCGQDYRQGKRFGRYKVRVLSRFNCGSRTVAVGPLVLVSFVCGNMPVSISLETAGKSNFTVPASPLTEPESLTSAVPSTRQKAKTSFRLNTITFGAALGTCRRGPGRTSNVTPEDCG